jgi:hypothetical protein
VESLVGGKADPGLTRGTSARFTAFLNSSLGLLLMGSVVGAVGLFTWQRQDWLFKEQYYRHQVMVDRRLNLVEQINHDAGQLVAAADDVIAAYAKRVSNAQKNDVVQVYNKQQAQWFGSYGSQQALLAFYFPQKNMAHRFAEIVSTSQELDLHLDSVWAGKESPEQAAEVSRKIRAELEELNQTALQLLAIEQK